MLWRDMYWLGKDKARFGPPYQFQLGFPRGSVRKNLPAIVGDTGDVGLIPGLERSSRGGNGNPLQYSCLENSMDRGAWVGYSPLGHKSVRHDLATQQQEQIVDTCEQWETPLKPQQSLLKWPHWSSSEPPCVNLHLSICWPCETHLRVCTASGSS